MIRQAGNKPTQELDIQSTLIGNATASKCTLNASLLLHRETVCMHRHNNYCMENVGSVQPQGEGHMLAKGISVLLSESLDSLFFLA